MHPCGVAMFIDCCEDTGVLFSSRPSLSLTTVVSKVFGKYRAKIIKEKMGTEIRREIVMPRGLNILIST
jgi:hypothetical protein